MSYQPDELQEILSIYKAETEEHLQRLNAGLLRLEKSPRRTETLEEIFREAHSLKGAARMIGFEAVEKIAHGLEDLFSLARKGELDFDHKVFDVIFAALDDISKFTNAWLENPGAPSPPVDDLLERLRAVRVSDSVGPGPAAPSGPTAVPVAASLAQPSPTAGAGLPGSPAKATSVSACPVGRSVEEQEAALPEAGVRQIEETIRVTTQKLDDLMNQVGEILVTRIKFDERLAEIRAIEHQIEQFQQAWAAVRRRSGLGADPWVAREIGERVARLQDDIRHLATGFNEDTLRITLVSGELQESINRVRMLPLSALFNLFPRLLRDIARQEGKEIDLVIEGGQTQLDKKIIEELKDPLTHLLRNALDHGIEKPEDRRLAGKRPAGRLRLSATQKASSVVIDIEDDGAGIDLERVRALALRRGFATVDELAEMNDQQVLGLVFRPGFSTKGMITDLSGRGVGLDVVLTNIEHMKGTITVSSVPGRGSIFSIRLPITLATTQALLVKVSGQAFAIPLAAVEFIGEIGLDHVTSVESREAVLIEDVPTALVRLHEILRLPEQSAPLEAGDKMPVVVLGSTDERVAFLVDDLLGEHEIVVKGLGGPLRRVRNISGASIAGDGAIVLILNVFDLIKASQKVRGLWLADKRRAVDQRRGATRVLVVDDSVTTRLLEKGILESNGYEVTLAVDGVDALEKLANGSFDLVVSDVEMPRMDGFEFTRRVRRDEAHRELPVVLVTSLASEEDKRAGVEAGADAYIVKGAFDQSNLIATIRQLL
ncbi:MAG: hybrid sensor histidine kinase/response regulator [Candidatus Methylomirabilia bacterium]